MAQEYTEEALKVLVDVMKDGKTASASRVAAASAILDRGYGKPAQALDMVVRRPGEMSDDELAAATAAAQEEIRAFRGLSGAVPGGTGETQH